MTNSIPKKSTSDATIIIIGLGVGCGCFGLIVLISILAAIALPSFLTQVNKAMESEARFDMGKLMQLQQAYFPKNSRLASSIEQLRPPFPATSRTYQYKIEPIPDQPTIMTFSAIPNSNYRRRLRSFTGAVQVIGKQPELRTEGIICQTVRPSAPLEKFQEPAELLACPGSMVPILNR